MSLDDLEGRLRGLKMADPQPGIAGRALETLRLKRHLRIAWVAAAAALLLAVGVGRSGSPASSHVQGPVAQVVEVQGIRRVILAEARPSPRTLATAFHDKRNLETRLLQGGLR